MEKQRIILKEIPALRVRQWLSGWNNVTWDEKQHRAEPQHWFYQFTIPAAHLKALSGIYARSTKTRSRGAEDLGIQRRHEEKRSFEIARFVKFGYPWSDLGEKKRESAEFHDLRKPGWLPTAIVINILGPNDLRRGAKVDKADLVTIEDTADSRITVHLPKRFAGRSWKPKSVPPIEVIDGQHRLWAFEEADFSENFELPVVAFLGLDLSWQAYLFYTINIKPKKINASLAFDLYPLLRTEDWLTKFEGHIVYRETRAQELVDLLWSHNRSPWHARINMLGEPGHKGLMVSQAAWIRSLLATYIKSWEGRGVTIGGLFGAPVGSQKQTLQWSRAEQAAFLIVTGEFLRDAIEQGHAGWMRALRNRPRPDGIPGKLDLAFYGPDTLLNQDQGIRAFLHISNDLIYVNADELALDRWGTESGVDGTDEKHVSEAISSLYKRDKLKTFLKAMSKSLASYDWRASDAPGLTDEQALLKAAFRGSGGYKELRRHVLKHLAMGDGDVASCAKQILKRTE